MVAKVQLKKLLVSIISILHYIDCLFRYVIVMFLVLFFLGLAHKTYFSPSNIGQTTLLQNLMKLSGPVEDPSPMAAASRSLILGDVGLLAYKATSSLINLSNCGFLNCDIDSHLLSLLKVCCLHIILSIEHSFFFSLCFKWRMTDCYNKHC